MRMDQGALNNLHAPEGGLTGCTMGSEKSTMAISRPARSGVSCASTVKYSSKASPLCLPCANEPTDRIKKHAVSDL